MSAPLPWLDRIAHDLRGPLSPLQTAAMLLRSGRMDPERQTELLDMVQRQAGRLAAMVDELDDWARANAGRLVSARRGPCDPALLLAHAVDAAGIPGLDPVIDDASGGALVDGDERRVVQLLSALLALMHARRAPDAVVVRVHREPGMPGDRMADDGVLDDGVLHDGMPDNGVRRDSMLCFEFPDGRAARAPLADALAAPLPDPADEGLGLRVLLAAAIATAHGGALEVADAQDGPALRCRLPIAPP